MGCSSSCRLFETFSSALEFLVRHQSGSARVLHVLDDFLFIGITAADCQHLLDTFMAICEETGVPIVKDKTFGPLQCLTFLGIELDCVQQEAQLPDEK